MKNKMLVRTLIGILKEYEGDDLVELESYTLDYGNGSGCTLSVDGDVLMQEGEDDE